MNEYKQDPENPTQVLKSVVVAVDVEKLEFRKNELNEVIAEKISERDLIQSQLDTIYAQVPEVKPLEDNPQINEITRSTKRKRK